MRRVGLVLALVALAAAVVASGAEVHSDFLALWTAGRGVLAGLSPYDEVGQAALLVREGWLEPGVPLPPFAYPPWLVALTLPLGLLPLDVAGRVWLAVNLGLAGGAAWLLSAGWSLRERAVAVVAALAFAPTLGLLAVGQLTLPVVLGAALALRGLVDRRAAPLGAGLALLTLKPHVGLLVGGVALALAVRQRAWRGLGLGVGLGVAAALGGLAVAPRWPVELPAAVLRLAAHDNVAACDTCVSLAWLVGGSVGKPWILGGALAVAGLGLAWWQRREVSTALGLAAVTGLLALPYVRNYDVPLLLVPLAVLWPRVRRVPAGRVLLLLVWAWPTVALLVPGRGVSALLWWLSIVGVGALLLVWRHAPADT